MLFPPLISEFPIFLASVFFFVFVPGRILVRLLKIEVDSLLEGAVFSLILGYIALHVLAHAVFLFRADYPWYGLALGCVGYVVWAGFSFVRKNPLNEPKVLINRVRKIAFTPYGVAYVLLIAFVLIFFDGIRQKGVLTFLEKENMYGLIAAWDDLYHVSLMNEMRNYFLPLDNPFLPGELSFLQNWLGNLLPTFWVKYFGMDPMNSYHIWGNLFFHGFFFLAIHYLIKEFNPDKWVVFFAVSFFYLSPTRSFDEIYLRSLSGIFFISTTFIFILKYFQTRRTVFLSLTFSWYFLYIIKGNYILSTLLPLVVFYLFALFPDRKTGLDKKALKILIACSVVPLFLFWISQTCFGVVYAPESYILDFHRALLRGWSVVSISLPILLVFFAYYVKKRREGICLSPTEIVLWIAYGWGIFFYSIMGKLIASDVDHATFLGLLISLPIAGRYLIASPKIFRAAGFALILLFVIIAIRRPPVIESPGYIPLTADELSTIQFLKSETPEGSVILYNVPRYIDRPAVMSALTYRNSFIGVAEQHSGIYHDVLESRLYDYWDFLLCRCDKEARKRFFEKYPSVKYIVDYGKNFEKIITPLVGMPASVFAIQFYKGDSTWFKEIFRKGSIAVYEVGI